MSKYLVVGDPHCQPDNLDKIKKLFSLVESYGLPTIWLGDLLHTKDIVRAQCLNAYMTYFTNTQLKHIILIGNHDWTSKDCKEHALEPLKALYDITIVDRPFQEGKTLFLPYSSSIEAFRASLSDAKYLFMHQGVTGCDYGNGFIAENELPIEDLAAYEKVISGHFHRYQVKDNLTYLGTPFSHTFGESNQIKYLGIFDDSDGSLELIETDFPKHITEEYHIGLENHLNLDEENYNRVLLIGNREEVEEFDKAKYPGVKFIDCPRGIYSKSILQETQTPMDLYTKWFKEVKKESNQELFLLGARILQDAD